MRELNQYMVKENTFSVRRFREKVRMMNLIDSNVMKKLEDQEVDTDVTNLKINTEDRAIPEETMTLLRYLSMIKKEDQALIKAVFMEEEGIDTLRVINFMWPEGVRLLNRFNDVIYCDSMWSITQDSEFLLTIVVKDNENNIRLAASAIAYGERKEAWTTFFAWVKENVPSFDPKCIVTDGATYINSAYVEATRMNPVHLVCWWHRKKTAQGKKGARRTIEQRILGVAYGQTMEEVEGRFDDIQRSIEASDFDEKTANRLQRILEETTENALIYLKVFTGGTLTNSYAESVNNRIRRYKLTFHARSSDKIPLLRNYCKYQARPVKDSFRTKEDLLKIMDDEVLQKISHGVLSTQQKLIKEAKQTCSVIPPSTTAPDFISVKQILAERNQENTWRFQYNNTSAKPCCYCNALVHNGMPCVHIIALALYDNVKYKIPYACFNKRFNKDTAQTLEEPVVEQQTEPEQEQEHSTIEPSKPKKRFIVPDSDSQHINAASNNAFYNDDDSIKIRGMIQLIESVTLKLVEAGMQIEQPQETKWYHTSRQKEKQSKIIHRSSFGIEANPCEIGKTAPLSAKKGKNEKTKNQSKIQWCYTPLPEDEQKEHKKGN